MPCPRTPRISARCGLAEKSNEILAPGQTGDAHFIGGTVDHVSVERFGEGAVWVDAVCDRLLWVCRGDSFVWLWFTSTHECRNMTL